MSGLRLSLLGGFDLRDAAGAALRLPTRKTEALLARLALAPRGGIDREALGALLWGGSAQSAARASLRQALSLIGKALGRDALAAGTRGVALADGIVDCDVDDFERCCDSSDGGELARAAALYRGDLLAGLALDEPAFEDWLLGERERLRERALDALARLVVWHRDRGETEAAIGVALRLLAIDPLEEVAHRALIRLYAAQGRRAAALRQYQVCVNTMRHELGTEPAAETRELFHGVLREAGGAQQAVEEPVHAAALIGRDDELEISVRLLADLRAGRGRVLALLGEAGIGKTRLAAELATIAAHDGVRVLTGRCYESQQLFPFAPWVEILRAAAVPQDRALLEALEPAWRTELARVLPELPGAEPAVAEAPGEERSGRLFDAIARAVGVLAARGPLLLVVEDLHWADDMSLRLIAGAGRRVKGHAVGMVLTAREEDLPAAAMLRRALQELEREGLLARVKLAALSRGDTDELVHALARSGAGRADVERIAELAWRASEGNPFVVIETVRAVESGSADAAGTIPESVRELIQGQLDRLGEPARQLLPVAATAGREFEFALLARAAGLDEAVASHALEELVRRQVLRAVGEGFDFAHDRIRRVVDDALLPARRRHLHAAVGEAIEARHAADLVPVYDRLAYHYARSERSEKAVHYLARFAERAARAGAHAQAIGALDEALAHLARQAPVDGGRTRFDIVFRKSRSLLLLGRMKEVVDTLLPEEAWVEASGDAALAGRFHLRLGATFNYMGAREQTARHATRALQAAESCRDVATMGKAHVTLANYRFWGRPEEGVKHGEEAVRLLERKDEVWWLGQAYWILGLNLSYCGRFDAALAAEAQASALAAKVGDHRLACTAAWATGFVNTIAGDLDAALAACRKGVEVAPDPLSHMTASGMLALALIERGEPHEAAAILDEAIPQAERFRFAPLHGLYLGFRGEAALQLGDIPAARELALRGEEITRQAAYQYGLAWTQRILGRIARAAGDPAAAHKHMQDAIATFEEMGAPYETARARRELDGWYVAPERAA
ncbi:MAG: AAA family ATPase [Burkholderiales bacterium]